MKKLAMFVCVVVPLCGANGQLIAPEAWHGALLGGLIGGIAGGHTYRHHGHYHHSFSCDGAAIGAGIGLLAGAIAGEARRANSYHVSDPVYAPAPAVSFGYGYTSGCSSAYVYYAPNAYCAPGWYYYPTRPNYALSGTLLGAASGALIGAGGHDAGKGAAIGAAAGLVLGSLAENAQRKHDQKVAARADLVAGAADFHISQGSQPGSQMPNPQYQISSWPVADSTYFWTPRPQIADSPQVPDAPRF